MGLSNDGAASGEATIWPATPGRAPAPVQTLASSAGPTLAIAGFRHTRVGPVSGVFRPPPQDQKSMLAWGSVVAPHSSVTLPSRTWVTLTTGISIDLFPREADIVHSTTVCSSLASTS